MPTPRRLLRFLSLAAVAAFPCASGAVSLAPDGLGQALIYPYYTARINVDEARFYQTLVTIVNHRDEAKSLRVRFREGVEGQPVAEFNLYLGPRDMWTGAVIANRTGTEAIAELISVDASCTDPPASLHRAFSPAVGASRTLEGFIEVIEMATLTGASAAAVTSSGTQGLPANCAAVTGGTTLSTAAPTGGLSGTLSIVDVVGGFDFTLNADALAGLSMRPFHRPPADPYPGFDAAEVEPVSVIASKGSIYLSQWPRGLDAVSAVLTRSRFDVEFTREASTQSQSDFAITFPTRPYYARTSNGTLPFWPNPFDNSGASYVSIYDRDQRALSGGDPDCIRRGGRPYQCGGLFTDWGRAANVFTMALMSSTPPPPSLGALLSTTEKAAVSVEPSFTTGMLSVRDLAAPTVTSLPTSRRIDARTGIVSSGAHELTGVPVVGFGVRTFRNGNLSCGGATCQGNYGGSFPMTFTREISP